MRQRYITTKHKFVVEHTGSCNIFSVTEKNSDVEREKSFIYNSTYSFLDVAMVNFFKIKNQNRI